MDKLCSDRFGFGFGFRFPVSVSGFRFGFRYQSTVSSLWLLLLGSKVVSITTLNVTGA